ncbi:WD40 repeat domain-containing protein [Undibacterium sp. Di26W]|uniref:WD40 repeat domain-containing protein n=1 Tax=Undibacterium sp. Di26W TaxID=3413035 RepID=UPI003BF28C46
MNIQLLKEKIARAEKMAFERSYEFEASQEVLNALTEDSVELALLALCDGDVTLHRLERSIPYHRLRDCVSYSGELVDAAARGFKTFALYDTDEVIEQRRRRCEMFINALEKFNIIKISTTVLSGVKHSQFTLLESDIRLTKEDILNHIFPYQEIQFRTYGSDVLLTGLVTDGAQRDQYKGRFYGSRYSVENTLTQEHHFVPYHAIDLGSILTNTEENRALAAKRIVFAGGGAGYFDISHDDRFLIVCGQDIRLWDIATGHCLRVYDDGLTTANTAKLSTDGQLLVTASSDSTLRLWNTLSGECLRIYKDLAHGCLQFCSDDQFLIFGSGNVLHLWHIDSGETVHVFEGHTEPVTAIAYTPKSEVFFSCSADGTVREWNIASGKCLQIMQYGEKPFDDLGIYPQGQIGESALTDLAIFPQGQLLVAGAANSKFNIWNTSTGECIRSVTGLSGRVKSVDFSKDGRFVVSASVGEKTIRVWDLSKEDSFFELMGHSRLIGDVKFSKSGKFLVSTSLGQTLRLWDAETWECFRIFGEREVLDLTSIT